MNESVASSALEGSSALPDLQIPTAKRFVDFATILGLLFTFGFIIAAIAMGQSDAEFLNVPSVVIVLFGTVAATATSYTASELKHTGSIFANTVARKTYPPSDFARSLLDMAVISKKKGILALSNYDYQYRRNPFLARSIQMAVDGYSAEAISKLLIQELDMLQERHKRSASITRRAAEIAPAMGLIGTLVGLVQMLADLENPDAIGPAMAVALLTTFYGAILGTIVMAPLAAKLEKNGADDVLIYRLIIIAVLSITRQENPRQLEMALNSELPPSERVNYFD